MAALFIVSLLLYGCTAPTAPAGTLNASASSLASAGSVAVSVNPLGESVTPAPAVAVKENATLAVGKGGVQNVSFTTKDGWRLVGSLWTSNASKPAPVVILVHGLGEDRNAFGGLVTKLVAKGWSVFAYDSRGHGESVLQNGTRREWQSLSDGDFASMPLDVQAAQNVVEANVPYSSLFLVGASIGANAVFNHAASAHNVAGVVLLSPGLEYHGLNIAKAVPSFKRPFYLAVSINDDYALQSSYAIYQNVPASTVKGFARSDGARHGTGMINAVLPDGSRVDDVLIAWMAGLA